jgi:L-threonylcarbamoyladenylate synthase
MNSKSNSLLVELRTEVLTVDPTAPHRAAAKRILEVLNAGGIVAMRTDTVYGLLARINRPEALRRLTELKERTPDKPFLVLAGDWRGVRELTSHLPPIARHLGSKYWPGPLTLILPGARGLPAEITDPGNTVGVRIPDDAFLLSILRDLRGSIAAPSANLSGQEPIQTVEECERAFGDGIQLFVDGGPPARDLPSTVVSCMHTPAVVLRKGTLVLTSEDLES